MVNYDYIIADGGIICYNILASRFSAFKTGGSIEVFLQPTNYTGLVNALIKTSLPYNILGATTNTLISDLGIQGVVISTRKVNGYVVDNNLIHANCGEMLINLANVAKKEGLTGLENLSGIPGSIGGGVVMNCGAYGSYLSDIVEYADVFIDNEIKRLKNSELEFGYRKSLFSNKIGCVLSVGLRLQKAHKVSISEKMKEVSIKRKKNQPQELSLGCVFKKINDKSAGEYIEKCDLKNICVGDAMISPKHANFIINCGKATSKDFYQLMNIAQKSVYNTYKIQLEREIRLLGKFEDDYTT